MNLPLIVSLVVVCVVVVVGLLGYVIDKSVDQVE